MLSQTLTIARDGVNLVFIVGSPSQFHSLEFFMHRRRDHLRRFLPNFIQEAPKNVEYPQPEEREEEEEREGEEEREEEELFENVFADQLPSSSEESLHLNELFAEPDYQDNPLALVIYQQPPLLGNPQMVAPFPFPIPTQQGTQNL